VPLANVKLIATGAAVSCSIQVGVSEDGETSVIAGAGGGVTGYAADVAHVTTDLGTMMLAVRNDAGTSLAGTDLDYIPLTTDSIGGLYVDNTTLIEGEDPTNRVMATQNKPLAVTTYCWSSDMSAALEASSITKATPGVLRSIDGRIDSTAPSATYYLLVMNSATLPADGAVTRIWYPKKIQHFLSVFFFGCGASLIIFASFARRFLNAWRIFSDNFLLSLYVSFINVSAISILSPLRMASINLL
jgi:hypothetical protein